MLLPTSTTTLLVALVISLIGWGAWICFYKATKRIRFEYLAYDFAWGVALAAVIAAFTLGMWNSKDLTFQDNFLLAGLRKMAWAGGSGLVVGVANMLLLAAVSVSRISVAFPVAFGIALAAGSSWDYATKTGVNPMLTFGGVAILVVGALLAFIAYKWFLDEEAGRAIQALSADPRVKAPVAPPDTSGRALMLAILSGLFYALFFYAVREATSGENGVSPYGTALFVAGGVFGASFVFVPFFLNFPVRGKPLAVRQYMQLERRQHVMGVLSGVLWTVGLLASLVSVGLPAALYPPPAASYLLSHSGFLIAAVLGIVMYREFPEAPVKVNALMGAMIVLMLAGMGMIAVAPVYGN